MLKMSVFPLKKATSFLIAIGAIAFPTASNATPSDASSSPSQENCGNEQSVDQTHAFWFKSPEGTRTFDISENAIVPHTLDGDRVEIEGDLINTYDRNGQLVGSIRADLPDGVVLKFANDVIYAGSADGVAARCIDNKWVALGINVAADALVCAPVGAATGGVGGFGCGVAVGAGITAASC